MPKLKMSILVEIEYEPVMAAYPEGSTLEDVIAIDLAGANDDPFISIDDDKAKWTITLVPLEETSNG
jgi:hypothetical protein